MNKQLVGCTQLNSGAHAHSQTHTHTHSLTHTHTQAHSHIHTHKHTHTHRLLPHLKWRHGKEQQLWPGSSAEFKEDVGAAELHF